MYVCVLLGVEPRALSILDKCSTTKPHPKPFYFDFENGLENGCDHFENSCDHRHEPPHSAVL